MAKSFLHPNFISIFLRFFRLMKFSAFFSSHEVFCGFFVWWSFPRLLEENEEDCHDQEEESDEVVPLQSLILEQKGDDDAEYCQ